MKKKLTIILSSDATMLWAKNLPILITDTGIVSYGQDSSEIFLRLKFQNISDEPIVAIRFNAHCYDLLKQELEPISGQVVQDFCLNPGDIWPAEQLFSFPSIETRRVEILVTEVLFKSGNIWKNQDNSFLTPVEAQSEIILTDQQMIELSRQKELAGITNAVYRYEPEEREGCWLCACGQVNNAHKCVHCNVEKDVLFQITQPQFLTLKIQERIEEEKRIREEKARIAAEKRESLKKKIKSLKNSSVSELLNILREDLLHLSNNILALIRHKPLKLISGIAIIAVCFILLALGINETNQHIEKTKLCGTWVLFTKEDAAAAGDIDEWSHGIIVVIDEETITLRGVGYTTTNYHYRGDGWLNISGGSPYYRGTMSFTYQIKDEDTLHLNYAQEIRNNVKSTFNIDCRADIPVTYNIVSEDSEESLKLRWDGIDVLLLCRYDSIDSKGMGTILSDKSYKRGTFEYEHEWLISQKSFTFKKIR